MKRFFFIVLTTQSKINVISQLFYVFASMFLHFKVRNSKCAENEIKRKKNKLDQNGQKVKCLKQWQAYGISKRSKQRECEKKSVCVWLVFELFECFGKRNKENNSNAWLNIKLNTLKKRSKSTNESNSKKFECTDTTASANNTYQANFVCKQIEK